MWKLIFIQAALWGSLILFPKQSMSVAQYGHDKLSHLSDVMWSHK